MPPEKARWMRSWLLGWIPWLACSALILQGSILSPHDLPRVLSGINDAAAHITEYCVLFLISTWTFRGSGITWLHRHAMAAALVYGLSLGAVTELAQYLTPDRTPLWSDYFFDVGGNLAGWIAVIGLARWKTAGKEKGNRTHGNL